MNLRHRYWFMSLLILSINITAKSLVRSPVLIRPSSILRLSSSTTCRFSTITTTATTDNMSNQKVKQLQDIVRTWPNLRPESSSRFFKMGPGDYAENDKFLGMCNPDLRKLAKEHHATTTLQDMELLLTSEYNDERSLSLMLLVERYQTATKAKDQALQQAVVDLYLNNTKHINNWNLVDISCYFIVGEYLYEKPKEIRQEVLHRLARSSDLWERRIAIVSTMAFIRKQDLTDTFIIAQMLLRDEHDLIHKAVGWLIREAGKKDVKKLLDFLDLHAIDMPKTMLRYAIEKLTTTQQNKYMSKHNDARKGSSKASEGDSNVVKAERKKKSTSTSTSAAVVKSATKTVSKPKAAAKSKVVESSPSPATGRALRSKTSK